MCVDDCALLFFHGLMDTSIVPQYGMCHPLLACMHAQFRKGSFKAIVDKPEWHQGEANTA